MNSPEYNPEKKSIPIFSIILSIAAFVGSILYFILSKFTTVLSSTPAIVLVSVIFVIVIGALVLAAVAKVKKFGSQKLVRMAELISLIAVAVFVILNLIVILMI